MKRNYRISTVAWICLAIITVMPVIVQAQQTPRQLFERAQLLVESNKWMDAIKLYEQVVAQSKGDRALAAQAQYKIGFAYEMLGNPDARKTYEQVITQYAKEPAAAAAKERLAVLNRPADLTQRRICSNCGGDLQPSSVSSDGRLLVYLVNHKLAVRDLASGTVTEITAEGGLAPVLSPDRQQIAYTFAADSDYELRIIANKAGAKSRILVKNAEYNTITPAAWSPDGKSILVVAHMKIDETWMMAWVSASDGLVKPLKSLGWRFGCCGPMGLPSLSPDGRSIAYAAQVNNIPPQSPPDSAGVHIYILSADGSSERELVKGASVNEGPEWMPDGKSLLFVSNRSGDFGLWSVALQDGSLKQVKTGTGVIHSFGVTRSGSYFYSQRPANGPASQQLVMTKLEGDPNQRAGDEEILNGYNPVWSPDGRSIAFLRRENRDRNAAAGRTNPFESSPGLIDTLVVYSLDTKDETRYVPSAELGTIVDAPEWSHDGKFLLQNMRDSKGIGSVYRVDIKTREFKPVAQNSLVALSPDGKTLYALARGERRVEQTGAVAVPGFSRIAPGEPLPVILCGVDSIIAVDLNTGKQRQLSSLPTADGFIMSADNRTLYAEVCGEKGLRTGVVSVDLATGVQKQILSLKSPERIYTRLSLGPDGRTLALMTGNGDDDNRQLYEIRAASEGYRKLEDVRFKSVRGMSWSSDSSTLLLEQNPPEALVIPSSGNDPGVRAVAPPSCEGSNCLRSPDGSHVVMSGLSLRDEVWALDNVSPFLAKAQ